MNVAEMSELWEKYEELPYPDNVTEIPAELRRTSRADLNAFILLDSLCPQPRRPNASQDQDIVSCAEHDQIWLGVELEELARVITEPQIAILVALGVHLETDSDSLFMFV